ncbi:MAG: DUF2330 domain-containing protein [Proteobacteria bacterium]|nr:DUF2330 domain-containing protein [Pseudomonadota bacterium]
MSRLFAICAFTIGTLWSTLTLACGGGFGDELDMKPTQTLIIRHNDNEETYIFNPSFCGRSADFGLILPVPNSLTEEPELIDNSVFKAFEDLTAPEIVIEERCKGKSGGMDAGADGADTDDNGGVEVIDGGQVGIFDWVLLHADDAEAFTDWLDANSYPYDDDATAHFSHYVENSWYFIAFKVTASQDELDPSSEICGEFGPIRFAFTTDTPIVPSRIAAVGKGKYDMFSWHIHVLAKEPVTARNTVGEENLRFTGKITEGRIKAFPEIGTIAEIGDQLTSLRVMFYGGDVEEDIAFTTSIVEEEYRQTITRTVYVDCNDEGCTITGKSGRSSSAFVTILLLALALVFLRGRRENFRNRM